MAQAGIVRMTRQRREIMRAVEKSRCHLTADEVYKIVRRRMPRISLGTVYRNLDALAELGLLKKVEFCSCQRRYETNDEPHFHLICEKCGCVSDLPADGLDNLEEMVGTENGYTINGYKLEFYGLCPECGESERRGSDPRQ